MRDMRTRGGVLMVGAFRRRRVRRRGCIRSV
jgi:hypothetical protein